LSPGKNASKKPTAAQTVKLARVAHQKARQYVGTVEAPNEKAVEVAAVAEFDLSAEQRQRLVVSERG
jgi:hypothetical protein